LERITTPLRLAAGKGLFWLPTAGGIEVARKLLAQPATVGGCTKIDLPLNLICF